MTDEVKADWRSRSHEWKERASELRAHNAGAVFHLKVGELVEKPRDSCFWAGESALQRADQAQRSAGAWINLEPRRALEFLECRQRVAGEAVSVIGKLQVQRSGREPHGPMQCCQQLFGRRVGETILVRDCCRADGLACAPY